MADLKLFRREVGGLFLLAALLFCACTEVPEYKCADGNSPFDFRKGCGGNENVIVIPAPPDSGKTPPDSGKTPPDSGKTLTDSIDYSVRDSTADGQTYIVYGGQAYKTVEIGKQTWMAQNLNFDTKTGGAWCYNNSTDSCAKYGRLYNWSTAMRGSASSDKNPSGVQGICPEGWHLPSRQEWDSLGSAVGANIMPDEFESGYIYWDVAGQMLKAKSGWNNWYGGDGNGADSYNFGALPGGFISKGISGGAGNVGLWWTTSTKYHFRRMKNDESALSEDDNSIDQGADGHSVRCVK